MCPASSWGHTAARPMSATSRRSISVGMRSTFTPTLWLSEPSDIGDKAGRDGHLQPFPTVRLVVPSATTRTVNGPPTRSNEFEKRCSS